MSIAVGTSRQNLANAYVLLGVFLGLCTGPPGSPASPAAPANEASGGSYVRVATTWTAGTGGVQNGSATIVNANAATYTFSPLCSAATGANMVDWAAIPTTQLTNPGQVVLTPTYTQS